MKRIDTDMTAAYLRAVQHSCEEANKEMEGMEAFVKDLTKSYEIMTKAFETQRDRADKLEATIKELEESSSSTHWHPRSEVPADDIRYLIRTKTGEVYFLSPVNGRWMDKVSEWMPIPT